MDVVALANKEEWDRLAGQSGDAWFWHTTHWMDYVKEYSGERYIGNPSFYIVENRETLAICPLSVEAGSHDETVKQFSFMGLPVPFPAMRNGLSYEKRQMVLKLYTETLTSLAQEEDVEYVSVRVPSVTRSYLNYGIPIANPLLRYGYIDLAFLTQVIDLGKSVKELWAEVRKGHKSDVKGAGESCRVNVWDQENITSDKFQQYQLLHKKDAGRATRSQKSFDLMLSWVRNGHAVLVEAEHGGHPAGFSLVILFGTGAYYGSSCKDPDNPDIPCSHLIQWSAIQWLKEHGYERYDIGLQQFYPQWFEKASPKDISIASFKRGFGGRTIPLMTAEFFYSRSLLKSTFEKRLCGYLSALSEVPGGA